MKKRLIFAVISLIVVLTATMVFSATAADSPLVTNTNLVLDGEYIKRIPLNATGAQLKENFVSSVTGIADEDIVKTGMEIVSGESTWYPVIVGDVNGDGRLSTVDYMFIKKAIDGSRPLSGAYSKAADIDENGSLLASDYMKLKKAFLGEDLYADMYIAPGYGVTITNTTAGGTVYEENGLLKATVNSGYRIKAITADGTNVYLTDGEYALEKIRDTEIVAEFEAIPTASAENTVPTSVTNTFYNSDADVYGINWRSTESALPVLKYIEAGDVAAENADFTNAKVVTGYTTLMSGCYKNTATIEDLEIGVKYYYIVGDASTDTWSDVCSVTPSDPYDGKVTFFHMSDSQDATNNGTFWAYDLDMAYATYPDADFIVNTGDIVQNGGLESDWTQMIGNVSKYTNNNVLVGLTGNHDYWADLMYGNTDCAYAHFNMALPNGQDTTYGMYYSFDYGDIHFVVLNTGDSMVTSDGALTEAQYNWLKADLINTDAKWKIVSLHNPLFSGGKYGTTTGYNEVALALRAQLSGLFVACDVDLVLNGHDHVYYMTYPMSAEGTRITTTETETIDGIEYLVNPAGPIHLQSGTAGEQGRAVLPAGRRNAIKYLDMAATSTGGARVSYSAITIEGDKLTANFYTIPTSGDDAGTTQTLQHSWGIIKR